MKEVTPEERQKAIPHVIKAKEDCWKKDHLKEIEVEPLIINVEDEEGDDDAEYTDDFDHKVICMQYLLIQEFQLIWLSD